MPKFYIEKIIATGKDGKTSTISFIRGLNVIYGPPNTGKSCILRCINFIFGYAGEKKDPTHGSPFSIGNTGYDCVKMVVATDKGKVGFIRNIEETKIKVSSQINEVDTGTYSISGKKNNINEVWLRLLGVEGEPQIISKQDFSKKYAFTWKTIKQMFLISEGRIIKSAPIFYPESFVNETYIVASLIYLLTGQNYDEETVRVSKASKKTGRAAVRLYISKRMEQLRQRKLEIMESAEIESTDYLERSISDTLKAMSYIEKSLLKAADRVQQLLESLYVDELRLTECNVVKNRYVNLKTQYFADIKRLRFISDGEKHLVINSRTAKCPVCNGEIPPKQNTSYTETAEAEAVRIQAQLVDLNEAYNEIEAEITNIESRISELIREKSDLEVLIINELNPQKEALKENLLTYRNTINMKSEIDAIDRAIMEMDANLAVMSVDEQDDMQSELKFLPKSLLMENTEFVNKMSDYITEMLNGCDYDNFVTARFDIDRFDICVDGRAKIETNFGKGYIAYLNTVLAFCVMRYLSEHGAFAPGILIADSPTVSFRLIGDDGVSDRMKNGLYNYLLENQNYGQIIIAENDVPSVDLVGRGANVIHFTNDKTNGRFGFLEGVYK